MRPGLRVQLLLLIGALLVIGLLPLYFAVSTYTRVTLQEVRYGSARSLARAVAGHVAEARAQRSSAELMELLRAEIGASGLEAIGVYDASGAALARVGEPVAVDQLPSRLDPAREQVSRAVSAHGPAIVVAVPHPGGAVAAVARIDDDSARAGTLSRLFALYTAVIALGLLVMAYFALTRSIVRPLEALSGAAERVVTGARRLELPTGGARELTRLGVSLRRMTEHLLAEEEALRRQVDEVERATRELEEAQASLVQSERLASVGRLAAGLAHEIGNPIAALMGLQDLLLEGGLTPEEERDFLERMRKETERIHRILNDLLQFARPGAVSASDTPGEVEVAARDTAALLRPQRALREVTLELDLEPGLPRVRLGSQHLMQVLLNLVMNAADACGPGGHVVIRAHAAPQERAGKPSSAPPREAPSEAERASARAVSEASRRVILSVEDDGPGVASAVRGQLFEPFVTTKEVGKGTGLGLSVCRGLVEGAGGQIELDEAFEGGTRFIVSLPAAREETPDSGAPRRE
ncbi:MAG: HAMP domain-containing protein [Polyangiaceae bacterium]|nr:HAMP domain-containing protein [Polyangiaceae bacterium]MCW5789889.1 HAMP domain-containing protein [Polyangiaceae bacterium]